MSPNNFQAFFSASNISAARPFPRQRAVVVTDCGALDGTLSLSAPAVESADAPQWLAAMHPLWAADIEAFGPWTREGGCWVGARKLPHVAVCCGQTSSTMGIARTLAENNVLQVGDAVVAALQEQGRGQLRRVWNSYPGNLHVSVVLSAPSSAETDDSGNAVDPPAASLCSPEAAVLLPHAMGLHCCRVLRDLGENVQIKWPNDLLCNGRKIGGILVEERQAVVVAGLGINLCTAPDDREMRAGHTVSGGRLGAFGQGPLALWSLLSQGLVAQIERLNTSAGRAALLRNTNL